MNETFSVDVRRQAGYQFEVIFADEDYAPLITDEPTPLGEATGPNPTRLLAAAVGNCLAASLTFCLQRSRVEVGDVLARVTGTLERNERGRWRIASLRVALSAEVADEHAAGWERCLALFEDFCIVTQSVREGLVVHVDVTRGPGIAQVDGAA